MDYRWIWMFVTKDEFEHPLVIADTIQELSERTGKRVSTIQSLVSKWEHGKIKHPSVVRVRKEEGGYD